MSPTSPFNAFEDDAKKPFHRKAEEEVNKKVGGRTQPASGAFDGHKGDIKEAHLRILIDVKSTSSKEVTGAGIYVNRKMLEKIDQEAFDQGHVPAIVLKFKSMGKGVPKDWILLPLDALETEGA